MEKITELKTKDKVVIMGFAPDSRNLAPLDDDSFDFWGINELYMEMPKLAVVATAWFQLHGFEPPTVRDPEQVKHLSQLKCPVYMWEKHPQIPNSFRYPREAILKNFDTYGPGMATDIRHERDRAYFTNTVSWMIALAIHYGYKEIHVYGVNMAQSGAGQTEYSHQRPSCEFFLGWARGAGIGLYLPIQSDLVRSWMLYGYDDGSAMYQKFYAREQELEGRMNEIRQQRAHAQSVVQQSNDALNQLQGAAENNRYMIQLGPAAPTNDIRDDLGGKT